MKRRPGQRGFSLIEMIGVLAIISIVAAILTPNLARRISRLNGEKEDQALAILAEGLTRSVRTYQTIPGAGSWTTNIAAMTGLPVSEVRYVRPADTATARAYLIHPAFHPTNASGSDPIFSQTASGASSVTNARILILSSHKGELALPVSSGKASSAPAFDAIWDWTFNPTTKAPPSGWGGPWTGNGEYLHVQRINLAPSFHRVTFSNIDFPSAVPTVEIGGTLTSMSSTSAVETFLIQGTRLRLFKDGAQGGGMDLSQGIEAPVNFIYDNDRWRVP